MKLEEIKETHVIVCSGLTQVKTVAHVLRGKEARSILSIHDECRSVVVYPQDEIYFIPILPDHSAHSIYPHIPAQQFLNDNRY